MTILEFAECVKKLSNSSSEISFCDLPQDDPQVRQPDISRAKKVLEWEPLVPHEDGLKNVIEYFQQYASYEQAKKNIQAT